MRHGAFTSYLTRWRRCALVALIGDEFQQDLKGMTVAQLRQKYPGEAICHRAMLSRAKDGVAVVAAPLKSFKGFLREMGPRPDATWTVDRIDPSDPEYAPGKVRWADKRQQANNRKNTLKLNVDGEIKPLTDWARQTGQPPNNIRQRLRRGATHEEAVYPNRKKKRRGRPLTSDARQTNIEENLGWPPPLTPRLWEVPYQQWVLAYKGQRGLPLTRTVFALWVVSSRVKALRSELAQRYPEQFSDEANDNDVVGWTAPTDAQHDAFLVHVPLLQNLLSIASTAERQFWHNNLRKYAVFEPDQAVAKAQALMKNYNPKS